MTEDDRWRAWGLYLTSYKTLTDRLQKQMANYSPVSLAAFEVLYRLSGTPDGRMRLLDLARSLLVSQSSVTRLIDRMERQELVVRIPSRESRRETFASMTERGREAYGEAFPVFQGAYMDHFASRLEDGDVAALIRALQLVHEKLPAKRESLA
jgi:DNA-binding MarR family transcriptional regulator